MASMRSTVKPVVPTYPRGRVRLCVLSEKKMKVAVTGAAGRTGALVVKKLAERSERFEPVVILRNDKSKSKIASANIPDTAVFYADVSVGRSSDFVPAFKGCDAVVIATSGVPQIDYLSLIPVFIAKLTGKQGVSPKFTWKEGQMPEQVDWLGQKAQIDAAKEAGVKQVVIISSMGGTQPDNALNKLGDGNILKWKRKAEQYLVASSVPYTIIHPGGLVDDKGGELQLVVDVDDKMLERKWRKIPRADVAELCVQCLGMPQAMNRSIDVITNPPGEGSATKDFVKLLSDMNANCDYSIHSQMP